MQFSNKLLNTQEYKESKDCIAKELDAIRAQGIDFDWKLCGSTRAAVVKLTNGMQLMVCPYKKSIRYRNVRHSYRKQTLTQWIDEQGLEVKV